MNRIILFTVFVLCSAGVFAQFAIVSDKDGYVNVRSSPKIEKNNIIDTLHNGSIVYVMEELNEGNWINIDFEGINNYNGYVYVNRIKYISDYQSISKKNETENKLILGNNNVSIEVKIRDFDKSKHTISYANDGGDNGGWNFVSKIDGEDYWGTDGDLPREEYEYISITKNNSKYFLPNEAIKNLFEPDFRLTEVNYDKENDILYIQSINSDGAGSYCVLWVIEKGIYKTRGIYHGF